MGRRLGVQRLGNACVGIRGRPHLDPRRPRRWVSETRPRNQGAALTAWEPVPVQAFAVLTLARLPQPGGAARVEHYDHGAAIARDDRDFLDLMEI